jgi:hypothetical protein
MNTITCKSSGFSKTWGYGTSWGYSKTWGFGTSWG